MHVWVLENFGYNLISLISLRKLEWTHTFDTHCIYFASMTGGIYEVNKYGWHLRIWVHFVVLLPVINIPKVINHKGEKKSRQKWLTNIDLNRESVAHLFYFIFFLFTSFVKSDR